MVRSDFAKIINWEGKAIRRISVDDLPDYKIGDKINPGLCWSTSNTAFYPENQGWEITFETIDPVMGHLVDYNNEYEVNEIIAAGCEHEKEVLIDIEFKIVDCSVFEEDKQVLVCLKPII